MPFVEARNDRDPAVGLGAVHGHLRLFQIDIMRRIATGTLAELFGHLASEADRSLRIVGFARPVAALERSLPHATRLWLDGFVDGINAVIAQADQVPPDHAAIGGAPAPWSVRDVLAISRWRRATSPGRSGIASCRSRRATTGRPPGGASWRRRARRCRAMPATPAASRRRSRWCIAAAATRSPSPPGAAPAAAR